MSNSSKARSVKRPAGNARKDLKKTLASKPARQVIARLDGNRNTVPPVTLAFNQEPGHRDLGLIPKPKLARGVRFVPDSGVAKGASGASPSVTTAAKRRAESRAKRKSDALHRNLAMVA